jgi:hypothetical protein
VRIEIDRLLIQSPSTIEKFLDAKTVEWWTRASSHKAIRVVAKAITAALYLFFIVNNQLSSRWNVWLAMPIVFGFLLHRTWTTPRPWRMEGNDDPAALLFLLWCGYTALLTVTALGLALLKWMIVERTGTISAVVIIVAAVIGFFRKRSRTG